MFNEFFKQFFQSLKNIWLKQSSITAVSFWILGAVSFGLIFAAFHWQVVVFSLAALACGGLMGFLFGIPRVTQRASGELEDASIGEYRQSVNTNLTEISDWLTKIIVGVSLVQLTQIPPAFESLAKFLSRTDMPPGFIGAVLVFFGVTGFLAGYLLTRLYLAKAFSEADRAANEFNRRAAELEPAEPVETDEVASSAWQSPREAVITEWILLYNSATNAIARMFPNERHPPRLSSTIIEMLRNHALIDEEQSVILERLRKLRNLAAHSSDEISAAAARDYISNAKAIRAHLDGLSNEDNAAGAR